MDKNKKNKKKIQQRNHMWEAMQCVFVNKYIKNVLSTSMYLGYRFIHL